MCRRERVTRARGRKEEAVIEICHREAERSQGG